MTKHAGKAEDNRLNENQRALLLTVVSHYRATHPNESFGSLMHEALLARHKQLLPDAQLVGTINAVSINEQELADATRDFSNFVQKLGWQGTGLIFDHFRRLAKQEPYHSSVPPHIAHAIQLLYSRPHGTHVTTPVAKTLHLLEDPDNRSRESISRTYQGCWDVFRFGGHGPNPVLMWAAMQITPAEESDSNSLPGFVIHYRPHDDPRGSHRTIDGFIVSLVGGQHMWFVGRDHTNDYPFDLLCEQRHWNGEDDEEKVSSILGMVKRRHELQRIMVSRMMCLRSDVESLSERKDFLDAYDLDDPEFLERYSTAHPDLPLKSLVKNVQNSVKNEGKFVLFL